MTLLALMLCGIGVADLARSRGWRGTDHANRLGIAAGVLTLALLGLGLNPSGAGSFILLVASALAVGGWVLVSSEPWVAKHGGGWALGGLLAGLGLALATSGWFVVGDGAIDAWMAWSDVHILKEITASRLVLLAGLLLSQLSTGNVVVRLVLVHVGALPPQGQPDHHPPQASDTLRGGRVLGPMERLIILGLGLAGQFTAASLVIAAKGLIRWPEIHQNAADVAKHPHEAGVDHVTEYFLVGSMVSWLLALAALALGHVG